MSLEPPYNDRNISELADNIRQFPAETARLFLAAIINDSPDSQLPIELLEELTTRLPRSDALRLVAASNYFQIWSDSERLKIDFLQVQLNRQQESGDWRDHVIPALRKLWSSSPPGSSLRAWAACSLAGIDTRTNADILASAFTALYPPSTANGYYIRRLKLWVDHQSAVDDVLPGVTSSLGDAWTLLGKERLDDRLAVTALLALALRFTRPSATTSLREEIETLLRVVPDTSFGAEIDRALEALKTVTDSSRARSDWDEQFILLLREGRSLDAVKYSDVTRPDSDPDSRILHAILRAEAIYRCRSSGAALKVLEQAEPVLNGACPEVAWKFHFTKCGIHRLRKEESAAYLEIERARAVVSQIGDSEVLYQVLLIRRRICKELGLGKAMTDTHTVIEAITQMQEVRNGKVDDRTVLGIAVTLGTQPVGYDETLFRLRKLRESWGNSDFSGRDGRAIFGAQLEKIDEECSRVMPSEEQEPILFAQMRFDQAQLALAARIEWTENLELYQSKIRPFLDAALRAAEKHENYAFLDTIYSVVYKRLNNALRPNLRPRTLAETTLTRCNELDTLGRLLRTVKTYHERLGVLKEGHKLYSSHLLYLSSRGLEHINRSEISALLEHLQDLKQPSLDIDDFRGIGLSNSSENDDHAPPGDESVMLDDLDIPVGSDWYQRISQKLIEENAVCLEFFLAKSNLYCFVLNGLSGSLECRVIQVNLNSAKDFRKVVNGWRADIRNIAQKLESGDIEEVVEATSTKLEVPLGKRVDLLPGALRDVFQNCTAKVVYVAPMLGLHGLPIHALHSGDGWSLSTLGPVMTIPKARHLVFGKNPNLGTLNMCVVSGPEPEFKKSAREVRDRTGAIIIDAESFEHLIQSLRESRIAVLCGHGCFDKERPERSRVALDHGLRLTVSAIQDLELNGTELVLISCWAAWSARAKMPIGELQGGSAAWFTGGAGAVLAPLWKVPTKAATHFVGDYLT